MVAYNGHAEKSSRNHEKCKGAADPASVTFPLLSGYGQITCHSHVDPTGNCENSKQLQVDPSLSSLYALC